MYPLQQYVDNPTIDPQEMIDILATHFGGYRGQEKRGQFKFQHRGSDSGLMIDVNDSGQICHIEIIGGLEEVELQAIDIKLETVLVPTSINKVAQAICFSHLPITGFYRYLDVFQIFPVPDGAPKVNSTGSGAQHPFLLQFKYKATSEITINQDRRRKKAIELANILNLLVNGQVNLASNRISHAWVLERPNSNGSDDRLSVWRRLCNWCRGRDGSQAFSPAIPTSNWRQCGYTFEGMKHDVGEFGSVAGMPQVQCVDDDEYYTGTSRLSAEVFSLPVSLNSMLEQIISLSMDDRKRFDMACISYRNALSSWQISHSLSFVSLVTAIESLSNVKHPRCKACGQPMPDQRDPCEMCSQHQFRLTMKFREFVTEHVPVRYIADQHAFDHELRMLYKVRSGLTHGLDLMWDDKYPGLGWPMTPEADAKRLHNFMLVVGVVLRDWLMSREVSIVL